MKAEEITGPALILLIFGAVLLVALEIVSFYWILSRTGWVFAIGLMAALNIFFFVPLWLLRKARPKKSSRHRKRARL